MNCIIKYNIMEINDVTIRDATCIKVTHIPLIF